MLSSMSAHVPLFPFPVLIINIHYCECGATAADTTEVNTQSMIYTLCLNTSKDSWMLECSASFHFFSQPVAQCCSSSVFLLLLSLFFFFYFHWVVKVHWIYLEMVRVHRTVAVAVLYSPECLCAGYPEVGLSCVWCPWTKPFSNRNKLQSWGEVRLTHTGLSSSGAYRWGPTCHYIHCLFHISAARHTVSPGYLVPVTPDSVSHNALLPIHTCHLWISSSLRFNTNKYGG